MIEKLGIKEEQNRKIDSITLNAIAEDLILSKMSGLKQYHIFWLRSEDKIKKSEFIDYSFLNKLKIRYDSIAYRQCNLPLIKYLSKERKEYFLKTQTLIADSLGNLVGVVYNSSLPEGIDGALCGGYGGYVPYVENILNADTISFIYKLAKMFYNNKVDFVFIMGFYECYLIKENRAYVRKQLYNKLQKKQESIIIPLEEYVNCCYEDLIR